jgi:putative aldouronate transport system substrate-binding protein
MKKVLIAGVLCLVLIVPVFAGGRQSSGTDPNAKHRISWIGWTGPTDQDGDIVKILEEKFNVDFDMWQRDDSLPVRIAAGEIPDVFQLYGGEGSTFLKYVQDGVLAPLPWETVQQYAPNVYKLYRDNLGETMNWTVVNGVNYGLVSADGETGSTRKLIVYRGDWIEKVGGKVPDTLAEFEDLMYKFARNDPDGNGRNDTYGISASMMDAVYGAYGYLPNCWTEKDGNLVYGGIQPEMKEALTILAKWYRDGVLHPEFITGEQTGGDGAVSNHFLNGQIGVTCYADYIYWYPAKAVGEREGSNITELKAVNPATVDRLVYGRPPAGPSGKRGVYQNHPLHGFVLFGAQLADNPGRMAKTLEILDYSMATYDGFLLTRFGVEGKHWQKGSDGFPIGIGNLSEWGQIVLLGGGATFNEGSWFSEFLSKVNQQFAWGATMPELFRDGIYNDMYIPPESMIQYGTELDKIRTEAYTDIITGKQPVSYFDTFVANWKAAGGDIVTRDANR